MPYCILEYSDNLVDKPVWHEVLLSLNNFLANTGMFKLDDIKSRVVEHPIYVMGDGSPGNAFVALEICILSGRDEEIKKQLTKGAMSVVEKFFDETKNEMNFSLTVRITDMPRDNYRKQ